MIDNDALDLLKISKCISNLNAFQGQIPDLWLIRGMSA